MSLKSEILTVLLNNVGEAVSGQDLAEKFSVSKNTVWKTITSLKKEGHEIEAVTNKGYTLKSDSVFCGEGIKKFLKSDLDVRFYPEIDSTNTEAKRLSETIGEALIAANYQNQGKGRLGRKFSSPKGSGVYFSLLLRPKIFTDMTTYLTIAAAVSVCDAITSLTNLKPEIKWVNDVLLNGKKLVGILCEAQTSFETGELSYIIVGIGINVNEPSGGFSEELKDVATALNVPVNKNELVAAAADRFIELINKIKVDPRQIVSEYKKKLYTLNKDVLVVGGNEEPFEAKAIDLNDEGGLVVKKTNGELKTITFGDVSVKVK